MLQSLAEKGLMYVVTTFPVLGMVVLLLGIIFICVELFVDSTPKKEDDVKWAKWKSGYLGPFIGFCMNYVKTFFTKFFVKK